MWGLMVNFFSSMKSGHHPSPAPAGDGARRALSTFVGLHCGSVDISSEGNNDPGADEAASPILQRSTVSHQSWPPVVPSDHERGQFRGEAKRDTDVGLGYVAPAGAATPSGQMDEKPANGTSPEMIRATSGGVLGRIQSGDVAPERSDAVGSDADRAAVEESTDGGWLGDTARQHSDAVPLETALPLPEGETEATMFLLKVEHARWNCTNTWCF